MKFDVISDLHADFYLNNRFGLSITGFVNNLLPENPSDILVIAGDIANRNIISKNILEVFSDYYDKVIVVFGNHDLYVEKDELSLVLNNEIINPYHRWLRLKNELEGNHKIIFLDGETFEHEGVVFGGTGGWYDLSYTTDHMGLTLENAEIIFKNGMQDSNYIPSFKNFNWDMVNEELDKIKQIVDKVDVMITHVPPTHSQMEDRFKNNAISGCFCFNGDKLLEETTAKVWICGHTHSTFDVFYKGVRLINQSFGYPLESLDKENAIKTVRI